MADGDDKKNPTVHKRAIKLNDGQRWFIGSLGAGGLGGGAVATFTDSAEAGPVAMIAVGAIFLLIGLAGVLPTRLKIGDNEAEFWEEVAEKVSEVIEDLPAPVRAEVIASIATSTPEAVAPALRAAAYEAMVINMVEEAVATINTQRATRENHVRVERPNRGDRYDVLVIDPLGGSVEIDARSYSKPIGQLTLNTIMRAHLMSDPHVSDSKRRMLIVSRTGLSKAAQQLSHGLYGASFIHTVTIEGAQDSSRMLDALQKALTSTN
jgi:hypothetical protein